MAADSGRDGAEGVGRGIGEGHPLRAQGQAPRRHGAKTISLATSGELFELEEQLRHVVPAFRERRALVSALDARRAVAVCLAAEESLRAGREIPLPASSSG